MSKKNRRRNVIQRACANFESLETRSLLTALFPIDVLSLTPTSNGATTTVPLLDGQQYFFQASGSFSWGTSPHYEQDAEYSWKNDDPPDDTYIHIDIGVNGSDLDWGAPMKGGPYIIPFEGDGGYKTFSMDYRGELTAPQVGDVSGTIVIIVYGTVPDFTPPGLSGGGGGNSGSGGSGPGGSSGGTGPGNGGLGTILTPDYSNGVRYADGSVDYRATDLLSTGFDMPWGHTRAWTNSDYQRPKNTNGNGWTVIELPTITRNSDGTKLVNLGGTVSYAFDDSNTPINGEHVKLSSTDFTDEYGNVYSFTDDEDLDGQHILVFDGLQTASGVSISVLGRNADNNATGVQRASGNNLERILYTYYPTGLKQVQKAELQRSVDNGSNWTSIRSANYVYYGTGDGNGMEGDLKTVTIKEGESIVNREYYRYHTAVNLDSRPQVAQGGLLHLVIDDTAYSRLTQDSIDPITATDSTLAAYAAAKYIYEENEHAYVQRTYSTSIGDPTPVFADTAVFWTTYRVQTARIREAGTSIGSIPGLGTYTYAYDEEFDNFASSVVTDAWLRKTTETFPDGAEHRIYSNGLGQTMLDVVSPDGSSDDWITFNKINADGKLEFIASPSAVSGFSEALSYLVDADPEAADLDYINDEDGLIVWYSESSGTTGTDGSPGAATNDNKIGLIQLSEGEDGDLIDQQFIQYEARTVSSWTVFFKSRVETYEDSLGVDEHINLLDRSSWFSGTYQPGQAVITLPEVSATKNGSDNDNEAVTVVYNAMGKPIWQRDASGFLKYREFDLFTGAVTREIVDFNTSSTDFDLDGTLNGSDPDVITVPTGWSTPAGGGAHLLTDISVDILGRPTKVTDPNRKVTFYTYNNVNKEMRMYRGWSGSAGTATLPTLVIRGDRARGYVEVLTMSATPNTSGSSPSKVPTGTESISSIQSLERSIFNTGGQLVAADVYFKSGLSYSTSTTIGYPGVDYLRTTIGYDDGGRLSRITRPDGTFIHTVYDGLGRSIGDWKGTNNTGWTDSDPTNSGGNNMLRVSEFIYDGDDVGNSNLTTSRAYYGSSSYYSTDFKYDFRDRLTDMRGPDNVAVHYTLNNLSQPTQFDTYVDTVTANLALDTGELRGRTINSFDDRNQLYRTATQEVDPASGTAGTLRDNLTTNYWYDARGNLIKSKSASGLFSKLAIDGVGRLAHSYLSYDNAENDTLYGAADDIDNDVVIEQADVLYDRALPIVNTTFKRHAGSPSVGGLSADDSFIQTAVTWYDLANRPVATANYGRDNGGTRYVYESDGDLADTLSSGNGLPDAYDAGVPGSYSDDYMLDKVEYDNAGRLGKTFDNKGNESWYLYDLAGRQTKMIENYTDGDTNDSLDYKEDMTTEWRYDSKGRLSKMVAHNSDGSTVDQQITAYRYDDATDLSLLTKTVYPDASSSVTWDTTPGYLDDILSISGSDSTSATYDRLGRVATSTDQRGVVHAYAYDSAGRFSSDVVTTISSADSTIRAIKTSYDELSRPEFITSYTDTAMSSEANEVKNVYDGWGNIIRSYQEHDGEVNTSTSPSIRYVYGDGGDNTSSGVSEYVRLEQVQYPNGRSVYTIYPADNTTGGRLVRPDKYADDASGLKLIASFDYIGASTIFKEGRPTSVGLTLDFDRNSDNSFSGFDRFGRIKQMNWVRNTDGDADYEVDIDSTAYTYDRNSNRLTREILADGDPGGLDQEYAYDDLNRLTGFETGTLSSGTISTSNFSQSWSKLDNLGNWKTFVEDSNGSGSGSDLTQSRTVNSANELTGISGTGMNWIDPTYDATGNMLNMPIPGNETGTQTGKYDAWNRLVEVKLNPSDVVKGTYEYDGLGRRIEKTTDTITGSSATEDIYFNENWQILETSVASQTYEQFVWDPRYVDAPITRYRNEKIGTNDGSLDPTFDGDGRVTTDFGATDQGRRVVTQPDGKVIVAGYTGTTANFAIARYNLNGSLDTSFDYDGKVTTDFGGNDLAYALTLQSDGKIVVVGGSGTNSVVARYNTDGSLDTSFDYDGKVSLDVSGGAYVERFYDVVIDPNGKIVLGGHIDTMTSATVVRLNSNGSLDTSFDSDGKINVDPASGLITVRGIAVDSSGKILLTGGGTGSSFAIARLTSTGAFDTTFDSDGVATTTLGSAGQARSVVVQSDGKIVLAGVATIPATSTLGMALTRFNTDGSLDTGFGTSGHAYYDVASSTETGEYVIIDSLERILVTGAKGNDIIVARFTKNGTIDTTFGTSGVVATDFSGATDTSYGLALQMDGKVVAAGGSGGNFALARYYAGLNEHVFYTYDANYNVTAALDRFGNVVERYSYTPYGKRIVRDSNFAVDSDSVSDIKSNFGHQGGMIDNESLLINFRNRFYHPSVGGFITRDPLGYVDGMNVYQAYGSSPINRIDPNGLTSILNAREVYDIFLNMLGDRRVADVPTAEYVQMLQTVLTANSQAIQANIARQNELIALLKAKAPYLAGASAEDAAEIAARISALNFIDPLSAIGLGADLAAVAGDTAKLMKAGGLTLAIIKSQQMALGILSLGLNLAGLASNLINYAKGRDAIDAGADGARAAMAGLQTALGIFALVRTSVTATGLGIGIGAVMLWFEYLVQKEIDSIAIHDKATRQGQRDSLARSVYGALEELERLYQELADLIDQGHRLKDHFDTAQREKSGIVLL